METCCNCGGEIIFRRVGGVVTPIHITGGCNYSEPDGSRLGEFGAVSHPSLRYETYTYPTSCPVCGESVFFYRSPDDGRVFFDRLVPPWPKHPCTDNSLHFSFSDVTPKPPSAEMEAQWRSDGWAPFFCTKVERNEAGMTRLSGKRTRKGGIWTLYVPGIFPELGAYPVLIKTVDRRGGKYEIATFRVDRRKGVVPIEVRCQKRKRLAAQGYAHGF